MKQRILTGIIAGSVFLCLLFLGDIWFSALVFLLAIIGYNEYLTINQLERNKLSSLIGLAGLLILTAPWNMEGFALGVSFETILWLFMLALLALTVISKNRATIDHMALIFIGVIYLGFGFHYMIYTRMLEPDGLYWTLFIFFCIWATDTGAYFTGVFAGKRLLWPSISPKKTVEGAIGGLLLSIIIALIFAFFRQDLLTYAQAALIGCMIAIIGQLGDFIQSAYKRVKGVKDSGTLLPGHGGVLDRVDSWLIVFPFVHLLSLIPH